MAISRIGSSRNGKSPAAAAFTLIELILVMALITVVVGLAAPQLSRFFTGRTLDSEARRFLALTRYGQTRAASEGVPIVLWVNSPERTYGLKIQDGFASEDAKAMHFQMADKVRIEAGNGAAGKKETVVIRFTPDGSLAEESAQSVIIRQDDGEQITIRQSTNGMQYVIEQNANTQR